MSCNTVGSDATPTVADGAPRAPVVEIDGDRSPLCTLIGAAVLACAKEARVLPWLTYGNLNKRANVWHWGC